MCVLTLKSSHRPDGKTADALAPTHACTTANASVNYRMYVLQRPCKVPIAPMGKMADVLALTLACTTVDGPINCRLYVLQRTFQSSHRPDGKNADALASTLALHNWECFGQLRVQFVRATVTCKSSHRPDWKNTDVLALILARTTANDASVNYRMYVKQRRLEKFPLPRWEDG